MYHQLRNNERCMEHLKIWHRILILFCHSIKTVFMNSPFHLLIFFIDTISLMHLFQEPILYLLQLSTDHYRKVMMVLEVGLIFNRIIECSHHNHTDKYFFRKQLLYLQGGNHKLLKIFHWGQDIFIFLKNICHRAFHYFTFFISSFEQNCPKGKKVL